MAKTARKIDNNFCPQALYLFGTYQEDGTPHFGLFSWIAFNWTNGEKVPTLGLSACIGEEKLTKTLIRKNGIFSVNLVTEPLLPLADYYGCTYGFDHAEKMQRLPTVERGRTLNVPTIAESPVSFEVRVRREEHLAEHSDLFLCEICGVTVEEQLQDSTAPIMDRLLKAPPVLAFGEHIYGTMDGRYLGKWGEPMETL